MTLREPVTLIVGIVVAVLWLVGVVAFAVVDPGSKEGFYKPDAMDTQSQRSVNAPSKETPP